MAKTVFITGGSRGIGAACAAAFAEAGYSAAIGYRASAGAARALADGITARGGTARAFYVDVADPAGTEKAIAEAESLFGQIDVLIACAGVAHYGLITDVTREEFDGVIDVNLKGAFYAARAVTPYMVSRKAGSILFMSSVWGMTGASCEVAYSAAKAGVIGLAKALAKELAPSGVRVNCLAPGAVETDMLKPLDNAARERLIRETPLGIIGKPEDVARAALFLTEAEFITGQVLSPNGGLCI
jgi:3-oxoacyl-[acyl-carrier protein] reductase